MKNRDTAQFILKSERVRPAGAIIVPIAFLIAIHIGLSRAGYDWGDYFRLINDGQLPLLSQVLMWVCFILWVVIYYPPALVTLRHSDYLIIDSEGIILPSGERIPTGHIESIKLKRNLAHHLVLVKTSSGTRKIVVTWTVGKLPAVRDAISSNERLASLLES